MSGPPEASFWQPILKILEEKASANVSLFDRGGSPGNLSDFEDILSDCEEFSNSGKVLAVKSCNSNSCGTGAKSAIVNLGPRECIICEENQEETEVLESVLRRSDVFISRRKKAEFSRSDIVQDLNKLLKFRKNEIPNSAQLRLFVRLDANAVKALELFTTSYSGNKAGTLYSHLNRCKTAPGRKLLGNEERLNIVEAFLADSGVRSLFHNDLLPCVPDLLRIVKRLVRKKAVLQDCHRVYQLVKTLPKISGTLEGIGRSFEKATSALQDLLLEPLQRTKEILQKFISMVESTVDLDYVEKTFAYRVKPDCDDKLSELADEIDSVQEKMNDELKKASGKLRLEAVKLENNVQLGFFFRVTRKDDKSLRNNKHFKVLDTHKGGVRFTTNNMEALNEEYLKLKEEYDLCQEDIVQKIIEVAAGYAEPLKSLSQTLAILDVLVSFSVVSSSGCQQYIRPVFREEDPRVIELVDCRHPSLEEQDDVSFIPNSVNLEKGKCELLIVTGPNMGGKSTYLRQTAISVLLAQIGCFVPCSSATISVVDAVFTRVGASDNQTKGLSTFMMEMLDSAAILEGATEESLIIIDELGRGTSTYDGFGLAWSIAEHIVSNIQSFCLFATHFHELTVLPREQPTAKNVKVAACAEGEDLTLLYRVEPGVADESFGVQVANIVKFPAHVVKNADEKLKLLNSAISNANSEHDEKNIAELKKLVLSDTVDVACIRSHIKHAFS